MNPRYATFWEHCSDLRLVLMKVSVAIILGTLLAFVFSKEVIAAISPKIGLIREDLKVDEIHYRRIYNPSSTAKIYTLAANEFIPTYFGGEFLQNAKSLMIAANQYADIGYTPTTSLVALSPAEGFIATFKLSIWMGVLLSSPYWIYLLIQFILPALNPTEQKRLFPFVGLLLAFLVLGGSFACFITIPIANSYLQMFNNQIATNLWSISAYVDYLITLVIANAFAFELAAILFILVHFEIVSNDLLISKRRHMIVAAFIIGAILTPPDIPSQVMLALPLIGLYELIILYARLRQKSFNRARARAWAGE